MAASAAGELRDMATRLEESASYGRKPEITERLRRLEDAADEVGNSWSGSNLGYHAWVHYAGLRTPPAGAHWSMEWGDIPVTFQRGSVGDWHQFQPDEVLRAIFNRAGDPDIAQLEAEGR